MFDNNKKGSPEGSRSGRLSTLVSVSMLAASCGGGGGSGSPSSPSGGGGAVAPTPTLSLTTNTSSVTAQQPVTLQWSAANASSCSASGAWSGTQSTSGSLSFVPPTAHSTYSLSCSGAGGASATQSVTITVQPPADPVAASAKDTTLVGADADADGVRDDLTAYITSLYSDPTQRSVMLNYARTATLMLIATDTASAISSQTAIEQALICGFNQFGITGFQQERAKVQGALLNTLTRFQTYIGNEQLLDGAVSQDIGTIRCNLTGGVYDGKP